MISSGANSDKERERGRMKRTQNIETFFTIKKKKAADNGDQSLHPESLTLCSATIII